MKIVNIKASDYLEILKMTKKLLNHDSFLAKENDLFVNVLNKFVTNNIIAKATGGFYITNNNDEKIGLLIYKIDGEKVLFKEEQGFDLQGIEFKSYLANNMLDPVESQIVKFELDTITNNLRMIKKFKALVQGKPEILILFVDEKHRGKGISKALLSKFYDILFSRKINGFYLYTTTFFNTNFYDYLQMERVATLIYDKNNCPSYISHKLKMPYIGLLYFGKTKNRF